MTFTVTHHGAGPIGRGPRDGASMGAGWSELARSSLGQPFGSSFVPASLFNAAVTNGLGGVSEVPPTLTRPTYCAFEQQYDQSRIHAGSDRNLSPATAALADGDDVRAGSLAGPPVANCATQSLLCRPEQFGATVLKVYRCAALNPAAQPPQPNPATGVPELARAYAT